MGKITAYCKWNLEQGKWCSLSEHKLIGRAFALADYETIINNENLGIDYVILAYGTRVENDSKDFINISESKRGIGKVISYFKKINKNIVIKLFLMDADAPIVEDARLLAAYIDNLASLTTTNSVNLVGLSKGGAMSFNIPKYFQKKSSFEKTNIYTIATPFTGTKLASPGIIYPEIRKLITSKLGDNRLSNMAYDSLISFYESISSNSHMDYDIAMLGGISGDKLNLYDDSLIKNMFSIENMEAISRVSNYRNLVTGIDDKTLGEAIRTMNFVGIGMCILNNWFFDGKSDGMVMVDAQREVELQILDPNFKSDLLISAHHDVGGNERVFNDVLHIIDDTIDEHTERAKYRSRKNGR